MENTSAQQIVSSAMDVVNSTRLNLAALQDQYKTLLASAMRPEGHIESVPSTSSNLINISTITNWTEMAQMWQQMNEDLSITKENIERMLFTVNCTEQLLQRWLQIFERTCIHK